MKHATLFLIEELYSLTLISTEEGRALLELVAQGTLESSRARSELRRAACEHYKALNNSLTTVKEVKAMYSLTLERTEEGRAFLESTKGGSIEAARACGQLLSEAMDAWKVAKA